MEPRRGSSDHGAPPSASSRDIQPGATALTLTTADGVVISALAYGSPTAPVGIVFGHGFTGSQRNRKVVQLVQVLVSRGFAVYTADFRGHGASAGRSTFGEQEVLDLEAVVAVAR